ncbi:uncharacterized protein DKFZp434B061-like [Sorghum bicolor]|uniref:uncharacterized protein DKFZp434B061-like n=1 Tax=Sorghum bicolor TaxID=4558 RepID=UPI000B4268BE|nr:uncharacterized protein DKFZp434B061-like [Sorghum bicolor]|eukprot:XP_021321336.1 uncharacterized protein DKFZp434B061-like [Sorghum bicolor]
MSATRPAQWHGRRGSPPAAPSTPGTLGHDAYKSPSRRSPLLPHDAAALLHHPATPSTTSPRSQSRRAAPSFGLALAPAAATTPSDRVLATVATSRSDAAASAPFSSSSTTTAPRPPCVLDPSRDAGLRQHLVKLRPRASVAAEPSVDAERSALSRSFSEPLADPDTELRLRRRPSSVHDVGAVTKPRDPVRRPRPRPAVLSAVTASSRSRLRQAQTPVSTRTDSAVAGNARSPPRQAPLPQTPTSRADAAPQ